MRKFVIKWEVNWVTEFNALQFLIENSRFSVNLWHILFLKNWIFSATKRDCWIAAQVLCSCCHQNDYKKRVNKRFFRKIFLFAFLLYDLWQGFYFTLTRSVILIFFCGLHPWKTNSLHLWATIKTIKKILLTFLPSLFLYFLKMKRILWKIDIQMMEIFFSLADFCFILKFFFFRVFQVRKEEEKIIKNDFTEALFAQISDEIFIINFDSNTFFFIFFSFNFSFNVLSINFIHINDALYAIH